MSYERQVAIDDEVAIIRIITALKEQNLIIMTSAK